MKVIFGVVEPKPLRGFPRGSLHLVMTNKTFAMVHVYTATGHRVFLVDDKPKTWWPGYEQSREEWSTSHGPTVRTQETRKTAGKRARAAR